MANLERFTKASVYINGQLLSEESNVTAKRMSGAQPVKSVAKGLSGFSPGAGQCDISVSTNVPAADFEYDPGEDIDGVNVVELTILAAGRSLTTKGVILDDNFAHGVDSAAKLDFNFQGQYAKWI